MRRYQYLLFIFLFCITTTLWAETEDWDQSYVAPTPAELKEEKAREKIKQTPLISRHQVSLVLAGEFGPGAGFSYSYRYKEHSALTFGAGGFIVGGRDGGAANGAFFPVYYSYFWGKSNHLLEAFAGLGYLYINTNSEIYHLPFPTLGVGYRYWPRSGGFFWSIKWAILPIALIGASIGVAF